MQKSDSGAFEHHANAPDIARTRLKAPDSDLFASCFFYYVFLIVDKLERQSPQPA